MTILELAERIEARLAGLEQEISRLQAAEQVLAASRPQAVVAEPAPQPRSPEPAQQRSVRDRASRRRAPNDAAARRASKPTRRAGAQPRAERGPAQPPLIRAWTRRPDSEPVVPPNGIPAGWVHVQRGHKFATRLSDRMLNSR